jgi:hypothetical protein
VNQAVKQVDDCIGLSEPDACYYFTSDIRDAKNAAASSAAGGRLGVEALARVLHEVRRSRRVGTPVSHLPVVRAPLRCALPLHPSATIGERRGDGVSPLKG